MFHTKQYLELIWYKTYADLRVEASRGYLGVMWWLLEPLLYMFVFYIVFGVIIERGGDDYVAFLLIGLVAWRWFDSTVRIGANQLISNSNLMQKVYVPKIVFPTITVLTNTAKFLIVLTILLVFLILYGIPVAMFWLALPLILFIQLSLIIAITWTVSLAVPFLPDIRIIIDSGLTLMFFMSGIFFDIGSLPSPVADYLRLNPMAILIESYRDILINGSWPDLNTLGIVFLASMILLFISFRLHRKFNYIFPKLGVN